MTHDELAHVLSQEWEKIMQRYALPKREEE